MVVDEFAAILRDKTTQVMESGFYHNQNNVPGYWAVVWNRHQWYWFSVSNCGNSMSLNEVATAISAPERSIGREGRYKGGHGYEATIASGGHSYMLGHGRNPLNF